MSASNIIFYLLAAFTLGSGLLAVTTPRIFRGAIFLLFALVGVADMYLWMSYEFVFAVQVIVYVGGIVVLIIFSIFLTQQGGARLPPVLRNRQLFSGLACLCGFLFSWLLVRNHPFETAGSTAAMPGMQDIGKKLLNTGEAGMVLPFELVSVLLLAAMIGCIVIALKSRTTQQ